MTFFGGAAPRLDSMTRVFSRHVRQRDALLLGGRLPDEADADGDLLGLTRSLRVGREAIRSIFGALARLGALHLVDRPLLRLDERGELGKERPAYRDQLPLALQHPRELGEVGLLSQSCSWLRSVVPRRLSIIVLMLSLSSATSPRALDLDRPREVSLRDRRGDLQRSHEPDS